MHSLIRKTSVKRFMLKVIINDMYIWTTAETVAMIADNHVYPKKFSQILFDTANRGYTAYLVAEYDHDELKTVPEEKFQGGMFWREIGRAVVGMDELEFNDKPYRPRVMRKIGLLEYLCDYCGVSTERNVSALIGEMSHFECKTPIEFFNTLTTLGYDK